MKPGHLVQLEFDGQPGGTGFGRLRAALPPMTVQVVDPVRLNTAADSFTDMRLRTNRLLETLAIPAGTPVAIQADCTGMSIALAAATRLGEAGHDVRPLQLFNPEAVSYEHLEAAFSELAERLGAPSDEARRQVRDAVDGGRDAAGTLQAMRAALLGYGTVFAERLGVPADVAGTFSLELINRYCAWLNFLLSSIGQDQHAVPSVRVYLTRPCPAVEYLRTRAAELAVKVFADAGHALDCPEMLTSVAADLEGSC